MSTLLAKFKGNIVKGSSKNGILFFTTGEEIEIEKVANKSVLVTKNGLSKWIEKTSVDIISKESKSQKFEGLVIFSLSIEVFKNDRRFEHRMYFTTEEKAFEHFEVSEESKFVKLCDTGAIINEFSYHVGSGFSNEGFYTSVKISPEMVF